MKIFRSLSKPGLNLWTMSVYVLFCRRAFSDETSQKSDRYFTVSNLNIVFSVSPKFSTLTQIRARGTSLSPFKESSTLSASFEGIMSELCEVNNPNILKLFAGLIIVDPV